MKNANSIRNAALQIKTAAENMVDFAFGDETANSDGNVVMQEACEDYILATLEFIQKAVICLTESVVQGLDTKAEKMDDTAFMPGELNSTKGEELDGIYDEEEEGEEE